MKIKLTPIALLATAATALYWKRRAVQAENRLTARVLAEERERTECGKKPDGFWDLFFSGEKPVTKPDLRETLELIKEDGSLGWVRTFGSYLTAEELPHGGKELGGVVPDPPDEQKLSGLHDGFYRVPKEIADEIKLTADEYLSKVNQELSEELNTCHCLIPEDMDPFRSFNRVPAGFNGDVLQYREALRKVVCRCDSRGGDSDE